MLGVYLSGTGNTKRCIKKLTGLLVADAQTVPVEEPNVVEQIKNDIIIFGYPIQFSGTPCMVRDFIRKTIWSGRKRKFCVLRQWERSAEAVQAV